MCSYVNNWNFLNKNYIFLRYCIEKLCIYIIYFIYFIKFYFKINKSFINIDFIKKKMLYYFINYFCI